MTLQQMQAEYRDLMFTYGDLDALYRPEKPRHIERRMRELRAMILKEIRP
jgi:hypothetical protein